MFSQSQQCRKKKLQCSQLNMKVGLVCIWRRRPAGGSWQTAAPVLRAWTRLWPLLPSAQQWPSAKCAGERQKCRNTPHLNRGTALEEFCLFCVFFFFQVLCCHVTAYRNILLLIMGTILVFSYSLQRVWLDTGLSSSASPIGGFLVPQACSPAELCSDTHSFILNSNGDPNVSKDPQHDLLSIKWCTNM